MTRLLSDFSNFDERCELQLATSAARSDCRLLWLTDPLEASGLPRGQYRLGLPGRLWWLDGERSRKAWHTAWQERARHLDAMARRLNLPLTQLSTADRSEEHTSELQSLMRISYAVFCLKKKKKHKNTTTHIHQVKHTPHTRTPNNNNRRPIEN